MVALYAFCREVDDVADDDAVFGELLDGGRLLVVGDAVRPCQCSAMNLAVAIMDGAGLGVRAGVDGAVEHRGSTGTAISGGEVQRRKAARTLGHGDGECVTSDESGGTGSDGEGRSLTERELTRTSDKSSCTTVGGSPISGIMGFLAMGMAWARRRS